MRLSTCLPIVLLFFMAMTWPVFPVTVHAQTADQLGRLFSTPAQRRDLDFAREQLAREFELTEPEPVPLFEDAGGNIEPPPPADQHVRFDGTVRQADNRYVVWIDGASWPESALPPDISLVRKGDLQVLQVTFRNRIFELRPGQIFHHLTATVYERYLLPADVALMIHPPETTTESTSGSPTLLESASQARDMLEALRGSAQAAQEANP